MTYKIRKPFFLPIIKIILALIFCFDIYLLLSTHFLELKSPKEIIQIFPILISSSSIIVSILIGYLFNRFVEIKATTKEQFNRYIFLQTQLNSFQQAFQRLSDDMVHKFDLDLQYSKPYSGLRSNIEFWKNISAKPHATMFVRDLYEIGYECWKYTDYETDHRLIPSPRLLQISDSISNLSGVLCRRKHYKPFLEELGFQLTDDFGGIIIDDNRTDLKILADKLDQLPKTRWDSLAFWEDQINKALRIVEKMLANQNFLSVNRTISIKRIFILLILVLFFGTLLPLLVMFIKLPLSLGDFLPYLTIVGFIPSLIAVLITIYTEISTQIIRFSS
jgi:hypothetical protein